MNIDYSKITDNPKVIELLKQRIQIENKIKAIDKTALIKHELELLSLPDVVGQSKQLCYEDIESTKCLTCGDETCLDAECLQ
jgi:hypothetical protein